MMRTRFRTHVACTVWSHPLIQMRACSNAKLLSDLLISAEEKETKHLPALFRKQLSAGITEAENKNFQNAIKLLRNATAHLPSTDTNREYRDAVESYIEDIKCKLQLIRNAEAVLTRPYDANLKKLESLSDKEEQQEYICQVAHYLLTTSKLRPDDKDVLDEMESLKTDAEVEQERVFLKTLHNNPKEVRVEAPNEFWSTKKLEESLPQAFEEHNTLPHPCIPQGQVEKDVLKKLELLTTDPVERQEQPHIEVEEDRVFLKALYSNTEEVHVEEPNELWITKQLEDRLYKAFEGHYALAHECIAKGQVEEALDIFEQVLKFRQAIEQRRKIESIAKQHFPAPRTEFFVYNRAYNRPQRGPFAVQTEPSNKEKDSSMQHGITFLKRSQQRQEGKMAKRPTLYPALSANVQQPPHPTNSKRFEEPCVAFDEPGDTMAKHL